MPLPGVPVDKLDYRTPELLHLLKEELTPGHIIVPGGATLTETFCHNGHPVDAETMDVCPEENCNETKPYAYAWELSVGLAGVLAGQLPVHERRDNLKRGATSSNGRNK